MLQKFPLCFTLVRKYTTAAVPRVCVIGSGPAGFYTSRRLTQLNKNVLVDMYEKLPTPFGLIRYGIAPDHPEVKLVENEFTKFAKEVNRFKYIGNVKVGTDISVSDLQKAYHAVVFSYGTPSDKHLGIPGEDHIISQPAVVGWYNGVPEYSNLKFNLDCEEVAVIGHGNVALDISRILLRSVDDLRKTDITEFALEHLSKSRVKRVTCIGRRGPLQSSFTIKEFREMVELPDFDVIIRAEDIEPVRQLIPTLQRPKKRIMQLIADTTKIAPSLSKQWRLDFLRSPLEVTKSGKTLNLKLGINKLEGTGATAVAVSTGQTETREFGMVIRSVGYSAEQIDSIVPLDTKRGKILNKMCRVEGKSGLYCSGWIQEGPVGTLITTRNGCYDTAEIVNQDITKNVVSVNDVKPEVELIEKILKEKGIQTVNFEEWEKIDRVEIERGAKIGKAREKIISIAEMLKIAKS